MNVIFDVRRLNAPINYKSETILPRTIPLAWKPIIIDNGFDASLRSDGVVVFVAFKTKLLHFSL